MKKAMRLVLLPAYVPERHAFLLRRWWFRLFIVIYLPVILLWAPWRWVSAVDDVYNGCITRLKVTEGNGTPAFYEALPTCNVEARAAWTYPGVIQSTVAPPLFVHFLGQLLLFRVVMDFVAVGGRPNSASTG